MIAAGAQEAVRVADGQDRLAPRPAESTSPRRLRSERPTKRMWQSPSSSRRPARPTHEQLPAAHALALDHASRLAPNGSSRRRRSPPGAAVPGEGVGRPLHELGEVEEEGRLDLVLRDAPGVRDAAGPRRGASSSRARTPASEATMSPSRRRCARPPRGADRPARTPRATSCSRFWPTSASSSASRGAPAQTQVQLGVVSAPPARAARST